MTYFIMQILKVLKSIIKLRNIIKGKKPAAGMMLHADGAPHDWFGTGKKQSLHGFIDYATGYVQT